MKFGKLSWIIAGFCMSLSLPNIASAITLDIDWDITIFSEYSITLNDENMGNHWAGSFIGTDTNSSFVTDIYCIEFTQSISNLIYDFNVYQLEDVAQRFQRAGWLMDTFSDLTGTNQSGALQVAIWEVIHEQESTFNPYAGSFEITPSTSVPNETTLNSIISKYNSTTTDEFAQFDMGMFATYTSEQVQDVIGLNPTPTPEPATMFLFGSGILGLAGLRFKRRRKA